MPLERIVTKSAAEPLFHAETHATPRACGNLQPVAPPSSKMGQVPRMSIDFTDQGGLNLFQITAARFGIPFHWPAT